MSTTLNSFCNIQRILVESNSLQVAGDILIGENGNLSNDNIISDFTVEDNTGNITTLYYSDTSGIRPWRIQQLRQPTPLTRLHLKLSIEYSDSSRADLEIVPNSSAVLRLSFFKII